MKIPVALGGVAAAVALICLPASAQTKMPNKKLQSVKKVVAYVPNWNDLPAFAAKIDYGKVTHLNVAFENPTDNAGNLSFNDADAVLVGKAHAKGVKVLVSIGGGDASTDKTLSARYFDLIGESKRAAFIAKLAEYVKKHNFDGLDIDLEGPSINKDYGVFVHDMAAALHKNKKLLTAALSQGYGGDSVPASVFKDFDFVNIMAYDAAGPWNPNEPGPHSSLAFAESSVAYWVKRGLPKSKAVLGVPFYGYGFGDAFRTYDYPYSELVAKYPAAENTDQIGKTIWHNSIPTIKAKADLVMTQNLAGIMIWSLDEDISGDKSLLSAIDKTLKQKPENSDAHAGAN